MNVYRIGPFELQAERLVATCDGKALAFGPKVAETLLALAEQPGRALSKSELLDRIWPDGFIEEANLSQNVYVIRKAFRAHGLPDAIETVARYGYRLTVPVVRVAHGAAEAARASDQARPLRQFANRMVFIAGAAALIAATLFITGSGALDGRAASQKPLSTRGARLYAVGTYFWNQRTRDGVRKSLTYFAQVINTDPTDPRGYAGLADANAMIGAYCYGTHGPSIYFARARAYAQEALALDPDSAEAHAVLGVVASLDAGMRRSGAPPSQAQALAMREGMPELERALALDPNYAPAQEWYGVALVEQGRLSEGIAHLKTASALDPLSVSTTAWLGAAAYEEHRFDDSIAYGHQALELSPKRVDVLSMLGKAYEARGDIDLAIGAFKRYAAVDAYYRPEAAALLSRAYVLERRVPEARAEFAYALAHADATNLADLEAAAIALGDRKSAADILRRTHGHFFNLA